MERIQKTVQLDEAQIRWLERNHIRISDLFRELLDERMKGAEK
jgi:hypothetical protein